MRMRDTEVTRSPDTKDRWVVMLASGDTRAVTLDELDDEFNAGRIDGKTLVLAPGAVFWTPLAEIAGLDDEAAAPAAKVLPSEPPSSDVLANLAIDLDVDVSLDLDFDQSFAPKRRWGRLLAIPAALGVVAAIAFAASGSSDAKPDEKTAAVQAPFAAAPLPPPKTPEPALSAPPAKPSALSDDQKRALASKDKKRDAVTKAKADARVAAPKRSSKSGSSPFHKGGDPHDPLNAKL
jgi:hypothetical protein